MNPPVPLNEEEIARFRADLARLHDGAYDGIDTGWALENVDGLLATIRERDAQVEALKRTIETMQHPKYNELRALAAEPNTSNTITAEDVRKRLGLRAAVRPLDGPAEEKTT